MQLPKLKSLHVTKLTNPKGKLTIRGIMRDKLSKLLKDGKITNG